MQGSFKDAVLELFESQGVSVLYEPSLFVNGLRDLYDKDSPELTVLIHNSDEKLLSPYANAASHDSEDDVLSAEEEAVRLLSKERFIEYDIAYRVCSGITDAILEHRFSDTTDDQPSYTGKQMLGGAVSLLSPRDIADDAQEPSMNDAPYSIGVNPAKWESVEYREVAVQSNKRVFIALGIAALLVVAIVGTLLSRALTSVDTEIAKPVSEQMQAAGDEGIEYRGTTYTVTKQDNGKYALTSTSEESEGTVMLSELEGTPVTLILYDMIFIIPENLSDGTWDLIAHPLGGGSMTQQVTDGEGNPIVREGEITEAKLDGDVIKITSSTGETFEVSLV